MRKLLYKMMLGRKSQLGETLVETLVAMVIAALALLMLAMAVSVSTRIIGQSEDVQEGYYKAANALATMTDTSDSGKVNVVASGDYGTSKNGNEGLDVYYEDSKDGDKEQMPGGKTVMAYRDKA